MPQASPAIVRGPHRQRGITGIETAIILIAFVVVAAVFAFTVLSTGIFSAERSKETVYAGLREARSSLSPRGSLVAFAGKVGSTQTVYKVSFVVSQAISTRDPIDLTPPYTSDDSGTDPDVSSGAAYRLTVSYADKNQFLSDVPWTVTFVGNSDGDDMLDAGEKAEITAWLLDRNTATAIGSNDSIAYMDGPGGGGGGGGLTASSTVLTTDMDFTIEVKPPGGAVLALERTLPATFKTAMDLR
jgi:flagellin FlaB